MANWYSADLHFGHHRIIDFCKRPFASTAEMNAALIANFQACVAHDDDLWILGDFAFGRADDTAQFENWFHSLPGRKHLIIGNHDDEAVISLPWASTEYMAEIQDGNQSLVLYHYPRSLGTAQGEVPYGPMPNGCWSWTCAPTAPHSPSQAP